MEVAGAPGGITYVQDSARFIDREPAREREVGRCLLCGIELPAQLVRRPQVVVVQKR